MQFIQHLVLWVTRNLRFTYRKLGGHLKEMRGNTSYRDEDGEPLINSNTPLQIIDEDDDVIPGNESRVMKMLNRIFEIGSTIVIGTKGCIHLAMVIVVNLRKFLKL